jgi:hypothetical protein
MKTVAKKLIVASDILTVPDRPFAGSLGTHVVGRGYDLLITDLENTVVIEEGTASGRELLNERITGY